MVCPDKYAQWKKFKDKKHSPQEALELTNDYRLLKKIRATDPNMTASQAYEYVKTFKKMDSSNFKAGDSYHATVDADFIKLKNKTVMDLIPMSEISKYDGKGLPKGKYTEAEIAQLRAARDAVAPVTSSTIMQKVVPEDSLKFFFGQNAQVGGFVAKAKDAAPFSKTMPEAYESMRLDYHTSPYDDPSKDLYVVRFTLDNANAGDVKIPYSSDFKEGGFDISKYSQPCTGNGYTGSGNVAVPEYEIPGRVSPVEAVIYQNNKPYAFYDSKRKTFIQIGGN